MLFYSPKQCNKYKEHQREEYYIPSIPVFTTYELTTPISIKRSETIRHTKQRWKYSVGPNRTEIIFNFSLNVIR